MGKVEEMYIDQTFQQKCKTSNYKNKMGRNVVRKVLKYIHKNNTIPLIDIKSMILLKLINIIIILKDMVNDSTNSLKEKCIFKNNEHM